MRWSQWRKWRITRLFSSDSSWFSTAPQSGWAAGRSRAPHGRWPTRGLIGDLDAGCSIGNSPLAPPRSDFCCCSYSACRARSCRRSGTMLGRQKIHRWFAAKVSTPARQCDDWRGRWTFWSWWPPGDRKTASQTRSGTWISGPSRCVQGAPNSGRWSSCCAYPIIPIEFDVGHLEHVFPSATIHRHCDPQGEPCDGEQLRFAPSSANTLDSCSVDCAHRPPDDQPIIPPPSKSTIQGSNEYSTSSEQQGQKNTNAVPRNDSGRTAFMPIVGRPWRWKKCSFGRVMTCDAESPKNAFNDPGIQLIVGRLSDQGRDHDCNLNLEFDSGSTTSWRFTEWVQWHDSSNLRTKYFATGATD